MNNEYNKWKSRTFIFALIWSIMAAWAVIVIPFIATDASWISSVVFSAGGVVTAFVGVEKWRKGKREAAEIERGGPVNE